MKHEQQQITDFMVKAQQATPMGPTLADRAVRELRVRLIAEELLELCEALNVSILLDTGRTYEEQIAFAESGEHGPTLHVSASADLSGATRTERLVESYDAILDIMVVTIGTGVALGLELEPGWEEVHRSNMSKFIDGHRRADGKWVKGPSYTPANLLPIVQAQMQGDPEEAPPDPA